MCLDKRIEYQVRNTFDFRSPPFFLPTTCKRSRSFLPIIHYPLPVPLITNHLFLYVVWPIRTLVQIAHYYVCFSFSVLFAALPHPCHYAHFPRNKKKKSSVPLFLQPPHSRVRFFLFQVCRSENSFCRTQSLVYQ